MLPGKKITKEFPRRYLAKDFDPTSAESVKRSYDELSERALSSISELEKWIADYEELSSVIHERYSRAYVATTVDTTDKAAEKSYMHIVENIMPLTETYGFKINRKLLSSPHVAKLGAYYECFLRATRTDVEIYRDENVALKVQERKLDNEFEKIMGSMSANFRGEELTMQQLSRYLEEPDRATRQAAWETRATVKRSKAAELDALYDRMLGVRKQIAANAGFKSFRDYQFAAYHRFDYTPDDCFQFHDAIAEHIVPLVTRFHQSRTQKLGVDRLHPWDIQVDPHAKTPIRPFKQVAELVYGCHKIFHAVDDELGSYFDDMVARGLLDLDSRKGKAPGGYCTQFSETRVPFIFMNAAGTRRDVETLLHEGGHAMHYYLARELKLASYHGTGMEFAEVASMSMELLSRPYLSQFYASDALPRVLDDQLRKILEFFPFMAMIDAFQHWVYTADDSSAAARRKKWSELEKKFQPALDWSAHDETRDIGWQYPHVFSVPFYYVEYGIAQLGALAIWKQSLENHRGAVEKYKKGLSLGGSKPLPELFATVGAKFGLGSVVIQPLVQAVERNLADN